VRQGYRTPSDSNQLEELRCLRFAACDSSTENGGKPPPRPAGPAPKRRTPPDTPACNAWRSVAPPTFLTASITQSSEEHHSQAPLSSACAATLIAVGHSQGVVAGALRPKSPSSHLGPQQRLHASGAPAHGLGIGTGRLGIILRRFRAVPGASAPKL
jgi:hypothetical protein